MAERAKYSYNNSYRPKFAYWAHDHKQNEKLCTRCSSIDTSSLFEEVTGFQRPIATLGKLGPTTASSSCPACRFFYEMKNIHREDGKDSDAEYTLWNIPPAPTWEYIDYSIRELAGSILAVVDDRIDDDDVYWEVHSDKKYRNRCIGSASVFFEQKIGRANLQDRWDYSDRHPAPFASRLIQESRIDVDVMKDWLQICQQHHEESCGVGELTDIKLIDCHDGSIVYFGRTVPPFFALSYVWGPPSPTNNHIAVDGRLPNILPRTIEDSINVTIAAGYQYLWIDRYCIDQKNPEEVRIQVNKMDEIYKGADVTIVAAAGNGPDHGLPGVGLTPRKAQPAVRIGKQLLVATMTDTTKLVEGAVWNTRGWTFQEGYLSKRRLIFTDQQAYWDCGGSRGLESVQGLFSQSYFTKNKNFITESQLSQFGNKEELEEFENVWPLLTKYSRRNLTNSSDAIRAFRGLLNHYTKLSGRFKYGDELENMTEYKGVPMIQFSTNRQHPDPKNPIERKIRAFLAGLCWTNINHGQRRPDFPSWSWAGWGIQLANEVPTAVENGFHGPSATPVNIFVETNDGQLKDMRLGLCFEYCMAHPDQYTNFIRIEGWTINNLDIQYMPDEIGAWTKNFLQTKETWNQGTNISGYFAVFKNATCSVHLPLYSLQQTYNEHGTKPDGFVPDANGKELIGLVLGRCEEYGALKSEPKNKSESVMILLLQDRGDYFERVGHTRFEKGHMRLDPPLPADGFAMEDPWPHAKLVFERKKRRMVRIG